VIAPRRRAIHLDTSFLIRSLRRESPESNRLRQWLHERHSIAISTFAWAEFLCGPLAENEVELAGTVVVEHVSLGVREAADAATLFNRTGRRRGSLPDCIIAATAIASDAALATYDVSDFERFREAGLELAE
jgi:predicted nucleic acid-binding protein